MQKPPLRNTHQSISGENFPCLDGLRGIAVLSVVLFHTAYFNPASPLQNLLLNVSKSGWLGVPIFFILSGFLISYTVFKKGANLQLGDYAVRRIARILPAFLLSILVFGIAEILFFKKEGIPASALAHFTTLANFTSGWTLINPVYWSLMIEIHFYIILPIIYFLFRRITKHPEFATFLLFAILPSLIRLPQHLPPSADVTAWHLNANMFPRAMDNFSLGILFSLVCLNRGKLGKLKKISKILAPLGLLALAACYLSYSYIQWKYSPPGGFYGPTSLAIFESYRILPSVGTFLLLFVIFLPSKSLLSSTLEFAPLKFLGVISYEWFLFHYPPVLMLGRAFGKVNGDLGIYLLRTVVPFVTTLTVSFLIWKYFSNPILNWAKSKRRKVVTPNEDPSPIA